MADDSALRDALSAVAAATRDTREIAADLKRIAESLQRPKVTIWHLMCGVSAIGSVAALWTANNAFGIVLAVEREQTAQVKMEARRQDRDALAEKDLKARYAEIKAERKADKETQNQFNDKAIEIFEFFNKIIDDPQVRKRIESAKRSK